MPTSALQTLQAACRQAFNELTTPLDRISEIMFGIIMALTFTSTLAVISDPKTYLDTQVKAALGCNLAWGLVDGVMFIVRVLVDRMRKHRLIEELRHATGDIQFRRKLEELLPKSLVATLEANDVARLRTATANPQLGRIEPLPLSAYMAAIMIAALVFCSTFPLVIPMLLIDDAITALRATQGVALIMLFILGWQLARWTGDLPWKVGTGFAALGGVLAGLCLLLGG